jgi:AraC-like DNA-binding protein
MNTKTSIPMLHVSAVATMMDLLDEVGVPLAPTLQAAHLPTRIIEERNGYVPFKAACNWADREARQQGLDNLGMQAMLREGTSAAPAGLRQTILAEPTLYKGICAWADLIHRESTHCACWIDDSGTDLQLRFSSTFAQDTPGQTDWIWFGTMLHTSVVRWFLGDDWCPPEFTVPHFGTGLEAATEMFPDARFVQHREITGLSIPREFLATRPPRAAMTDPGHAALPAPPETLASCIEEVIRLALADGAPLIDTAADFAGMSVRTLQRRLAEQNLTYDQIVRNVRFDEAQQMLEETDRPIRDIANALGYNNATHFARAFRRMAGMSPRKYRKFRTH